MMSDYSGSGSDPGEALDEVESGEETHDFDLIDLVGIEESDTDDIDLSLPDGAGYVETAEIIESEDGIDDGRARVEKQAEAGAEVEQQDNVQKSSTDPSKSAHLSVKEYPNEFCSMLLDVLKKEFPGEKM